jgi:two-component system, response regulator
MRPCILLVEDDPDDAFFLKRAFEQLDFDCDLTKAEDGQEALDCLKGPAAGRSRPTHMILDISVPKVSGLDILSWMRSRPELRSIPVIVLSGSAEPAHARWVQSLGIDAMMKKPLSLDGLAEIARDIGRRWGIAPRRPPDDD